jgi:hypothetical protein
MNYLAYARKALLAAVTAAIGAYSAAAVGGGVNANEWLAIVITAIVAGAGVFGIKNDVKPGTPGTEEPMVVVPVEDDTDVQITPAPVGPED